MEDNSEAARLRRDPSLELARQRAELLGLPPPPEPRKVQDVIPSSPPPSYEHVLAETRLAAAKAESACRTPDEETEERSTKGTVAKRPEILHKSSKELYRAVAAQWGITCKMSDHCRCLDCQGRYFDCEYDQNDQEKTDGGLGAGTPMFISEVIHGTACNIL
ncbi:uncharacterized protein LOC110828074 [Zootermopsis nevadensis]|uniref:DUF4802 domain-containing protein n=1 Tax=Zootermopsis nevadensis TaxID=136037 RepID=A0A067REE4_ZOONE|nr:uncharacterized protein LOC110828074 [Zootermopsis nevadensis]KDR21413.1 hypothetical protein L798_04165 [Zootermopsis nevadensis]